jgi:hypothetical protein
VLNAVAVPAPAQLRLSAVRHLAVAGLTAAALARALCAVKKCATGPARVIISLTFIALTITSTERFTAGDALTVNGPARVAGLVRATLEYAPALGAPLLGRTLAHVGLLFQVGHAPGPVARSPGSL